MVNSEQTIHSEVTPNTAVSYDTTLGRMHISPGFEKSRDEVDAELGFLLQKVEFVHRIIQHNLNDNLSVTNLNRARPKKPMENIGDLELTPENMHIFVLNKLGFLHGINFEDDTLTYALSPFPKSELHKQARAIALFEWGIFYNKSIERKNKDIPKITNNQIFEALPRDVQYKISDVNSSRVPGLAVGSTVEQFLGEYFG